MIIHLNPDWRIASDPLQWISQKRRAANGRDKWESKSFHGTLDSAVLWVAQHQIRLLGGEYGPDALLPLCHAVDSLKAEILAALKDLQSQKSDVSLR
jgi:hypothetical protein